MTDEGKDTARILASESQLKAILEASPIGVSISRYYDGKIIYVNSSLVKLKGGSANELLGSDSIEHYHDQDDIRWVIKQLRQHRPVTNHEMEMNRTDGSTVWCQVNMVATSVDKERVILTWFNDIGEIRLARQQLKHMASHDTLTGLPNRKYFEDFMTQAFARARRLSKLGSLLYIDLDGFKAVNDSLGHHFGDYLLQQTSQRMIAILRETDFVARLGGDEFAVIIESLSDSMLPEQVAQKLLESIKMPYEMEGHRTSVDSSIGIANFGFESMEIDLIIRRADTAMYRAKNGGKGRVCVFDPNLDSEAV